MDTKKARRKGSFIEVQALFLSMLRMHNDLAKLTKTKALFKGIEKDYQEAVRKFFFKDGMLLDTYPDEANNIRPNIFLAYYAYPDLLSKAEWKLAFDNALKELWLDWGGLSTIQHKSPDFKQEYTGENDDSYHNGDSWFYVNNYSALAMYRLDSAYYAKQIDRIKHASREELLFSGFIGCAAEVSSAKSLRSEGCLSQAWSAASYVELLYEAMNKE
jgi:glycogen debranching enzyme